MKKRYLDSIEKIYGKEKSLIIAEHTFLDKYLPD